MHPALAKMQTVTAMRITDFAIGKAQGKFARDANLFVMAMRTRSTALKLRAMGIVEESGRDLANVERRVGHIGTARFNFNFNAYRDE